MSPAYDPVADSVIAYANRAPRPEPAPAPLEFPDNPYYEIVQSLKLAGDPGDRWAGLADAKDLFLRAKGFLRREAWAEVFVRPVLTKAKADDYASSFTFRDHLREMFAYAIPSPDAVQAIARLGTIVEIGAGSGYWASQLARSGATVHVFDNGSWELRSRWYPVRRGGAVAAGRVEADALLLCWPPYNRGMAANALRAFRGSVVAYIGEGDGGCTADDSFHRALDRSWHLRNEVRLPQFYGLHDRLCIYERASS